jgi:hypothetical protein
VSNISIFKVLYHYEVGGKPNQGSGWHQDYVAAAAGDPATLATVLTNNGRATPAGHTIVFDSISNHGVGSLLS